MKNGHVVGFESNGQIDFTLDESVYDTETEIKDIYADDPDVERLVVGKKAPAPLPRVLFRISPEHLLEDAYDKMYEMSHGLETIDYSSIDPQKLKNLSDKLAKTVDEWSIEDNVHIEGFIVEDIHELDF